MVRNIESGEVVHEFQRRRNLKGLAVVETTAGNRTLYTCNEDGKFIASTFDDTVVKTMKVGKDVQCLAVDPSNPSRFVVGGKEQLLTLWDVEKEAAVFRARNVS